MVTNAISTPGSMSFIHIDYRCSNKKNLLWRVQVATDVHFLFETGVCDVSEPSQYVCFISLRACH
jgi:hypothetical protein